MDTPPIYSDNQRLLFSEKAHVLKDLKTLLIPWFSFRLYIYFKNGETDKRYNDNRQGRHFYGNEHRCTYTQCLYSRVPDIRLDKKVGYQELIKLVERGTFKGKYSSAKIFTESEPGKNRYDIVVREYSKGKLMTKSLNEPEFSGDSMLIRSVDDQGNVTEYSRPANHTLYYTIEKGRLSIHEDPVRLLNT